MAVGAIGKKIELLFFYAAFHIAAGTIQLAIKSLEIALEIGHHVLRDAALDRVRDVDNDMAKFILGLGSGEDLVKLTLITGAAFKARLGLIDKRTNHGIEALILGDAHDVIDNVAFAPALPLPTVKATGCAKDDPHLRPGLPQCQITLEFHNFAVAASDCTNSALMGRGRPMA